MNIIAISKKTYFLRVEGRWRMLGVSREGDAGGAGGMRRWGFGERHSTWQHFGAIAGGRGTSWHFKRDVPPQ